MGSTLQLAVQRFCQNMILVVEWHINSNFDFIVYTIEFLFSRYCIGCLMNIDQSIKLPTLFVIYVPFLLELFTMDNLICLLFYLFGFYVAFNTVQVISRWVVRRAEETSTYSWSRVCTCTVNCRPTASNYQLSYLR